MINFFFFFLDFLSDIKSSDIKKIINFPFMISEVLTSKKNVNFPLMISEVPTSKKNVDFPSIFH